MSGEVSDKLDEIRESIFEIKIAIAEHKQQEQNHQQNIQRFWDVTWPKALEKMDSNSTRIAGMNIELTELRTKVMIWGVTLTVGVPAIATLLQHIKW